MDTETNDERLKRIVWTTWQAIGPDALSACHQEGVKLDEDSAIEVILDADRPEQYGSRTIEDRMALAEFRLLSWDQQCERVKQLMGGTLV